MTEFQVGDRVSVEGVVTAVIGQQVVMHPDRSPTGGYYFRPDSLTLVDRPKRKLRVGSVWERASPSVSKGFDRYIWTGATFVAPNGFDYYDRDTRDLDTHPQLWREVPVEELQREAER